MEDNLLHLINELKQQIVYSRYTTAKLANAESLKLYYSIGYLIESKTNEKEWGTKVLDDISNRLQLELPGLRGFSASNLKKMRIFYNAWASFNLLSSLPTNLLNNTAIEISSLPTNQMGQHKEVMEIFISISFTHHFEIITKIKKTEDRIYYIQQSAQNLWTVNHLKTELQNQSHLHTQSLPNNFNHTLPDILSNKAIRAFKDQYLLDFVNVEDADDEVDERILENKIVENIKKFLMSLGNDFTFMSNQYRLMVSEEEYFIDLLFFHRGLQCLVAFELKKGKFKPEYIGKMNFYLSALDDTIKQAHEKPSIGIILCKEKNNKKVEYSIRDISKPMGVATYKTTTKLPAELQKALPNAETLKKLLD